jgi:hypothetical protein
MVFSVSEMALHWSQFPSDGDTDASCDTEVHTKMMKQCGTLPQSVNVNKNSELKSNFVLSIVASELTEWYWRGPPVRA